MSDIEEIRRLHHAYTYTFDSGDFDGFAALFEHGTLHLRGVDDPATGSAAVRRLVDRCVILYDGVPATNHLMHNLVVDIDDDGETARASTYVQVLQGLPDFPPQTIATAFYRDLLRKRDGAWTFSERVTDGSLAATSRVTFAAGATAPTCSATRNGPRSSAGPWGPLLDAFRRGEAMCGQNAPVAPDTQPITG